VLSDQNRKKFLNKITHINSAMKKKHIFAVTRGILRQWAHIAHAHYRQIFVRRDIGISFWNVCNKVKLSLYRP
jgi:hypothetical protein